jgi:hypothetical protein
MVDSIASTIFEYDRFVDFCPTSRVEQQISMGIPATLLSFNFQLDNLCMAAIRLIDFVCRFD